MSMLDMLDPSGKLDVDVNAGSKVELHKRFHRLLSGLEDVEQTVVGAALELLTGLLVHVRSTEHRPLIDCGRQGEGTPNLDSGPLGGFQNLVSRLVEKSVIVRLQADADLVASRHLNPLNADYHR